MSKRATAGLAVAVTATGLLTAFGIDHGSAATPPPNPSNGQLSAAASERDALASQVGALTGQIASAQNELTVLQGKAEAAEQKVAYAVYKVQLAQAAVVTSEAKLHSAAVRVAGAQAKFAQYMQASYESGQPDTTTGSLLSASDPSTLLDESTLEQYAAQSKLSAVGNLQAANVAKSNDEAAAREARVRARQAEDGAKRQEADAQRAAVAQQQQTQTLQATLVSSQTALVTAKSKLATLTHQRAAFVAWQVEQAKLAAEARARARRLAAQRRAAQLAAEQAAARARARHHHQSGGGGGGSSSGGGGGVIDPVGGSWTAARGREAVARAKSELGVPYAWAGGGASGPSYGVCSPANGAPNDCNVDGFDCSGLAMYAWGPWLAMPHLAMLQYGDAGSYHPSLDDLRPGDLLFYSYNGAVSGIHHVAIYAGNGLIVQAPYSGAYVEISSMYGPGPIFGATRPLT